MHPAIIRKLKYRINNMVRKICVLGAFLCTNAYAEEVIDPSDLTKVYTQAAVFVNSDADIRTAGMMTGAWSENIQFAGFIEANWGELNSDKADKFSLDYKSSRTQYFQVHAMGDQQGIFPRVGLSFDYIHQKVPNAKDAQLLSVGTIGVLNPTYTNGKFMLFPNVAYAVGDISGEQVDGVMLNLFATIPVSDSGAFIQAWPEYFSVSGDNVNLNSMTYNLMLNAPLKQDRTQWLMTKLEYNSIDMNGFKADGELTLEVGVKWFF